MKRLFAALRFAEDANISDRIYWYAADFPLREGEEVLAPVGAHDRLQCAVVERTLLAEERDAPYDVRLIKRVAAKKGARKLEADGEEFLEFGGLRYDRKRFTPFGKVLLGKRAPADTEALSAYGVTNRPDLSADDPALYREIADAPGCVLLVGEEGERAFRRLVSLVRGEAVDLPDATVAAFLKEKLT